MRRVSDFRPLFRPSFACTLVSLVSVMVCLCLLCVFLCPGMNDVSGSDSESEWSSSEGGRQMFAFSGRSSASAAAAAGHKKPRKKKSIPVAPPKLPSFESSLFPHVTASNGQSSPSSSYPKLLNVLPDTSGNASSCTPSLLRGSSVSFPRLSLCVPCLTLDVAIDVHSRCRQYG